MTGRAVQDIRRISPQDFAALGLDGLAYVKPVEVPGGRAYAIHAADGTQVAVIIGDREVACAAVRQNDLEPVSVH